MNMKWIDSTDLKIWAQRRDCQDHLPLVISRLIIATSTSSSIKFISFPEGDAIVQPGWDGKLESLEETEYIPKGLSGWELGTNKDIRKKAEEDYKTRSQDPNGLKPSETTYVFVTPRVWTKKDEWVREKKKDKIWRDVRAYDARDLEEWLTQAPAVGAWLAKHIGKYPKNVLSLADWWNEWSSATNGSATNPSLIPELILGGREKEKEKVLDWLRSSYFPLAVQFFTKDEVIGFLASVILTAIEDEKENFLSRAIVVKDEDSFEHIVTTCKNNLIIVPKFENVDSTLSYSNNHRIFIPLELDNTVFKDKIILPVINRGDFISSLKKMGISQDKAERLSVDTTRIISVLRKRLIPISQQPGWAKYDKAKDLLPAILMGKWDEDEDGDRSIVSEIAKITYDKFVESLKGYLYVPDPPIIKIGSMWKLTSHIDAFFTLSPFLTRNHFDNFKSVSFKVLKEIDPSLDLELEKSWMDPVYWKVPKYSKELRKGIVQTLILIAVFGDKVNNGRGLDLPSMSQSWVDNLVWELLNNANWKLWHSLSDILPLIAEASPSSFLDAVEKSLSQNPPPIMKLFSKTDSLFSVSAYSNLLWALEGLAWSPKLLARVALILAKFEELDPDDTTADRPLLAKLEELDPGYAIANKPFNSLRSIFFLWSPQTYANLKQRLEVIDLLLKKEPEVAWKLLINLLPQHYSDGIKNYKPCWREFSEEVENSFMSKEYSEGITEIVDRTLKNADGNGKRWCEIMQHFHDLYPFPHEREKIICKMSEVVDLISEGRCELWNKLREILHNHHFYSNSNWVLSEEELDKIEELYSSLEPRDIIQRFQWLFDDDFHGFPKYPNGPKFNLNNNNLEDASKDVNEDRKKALQAIKNDSGIKGIAELSSHVKDPRIVGNTLCEISLTSEEEESLFALLCNSEKNKTLLAQAYISGKARKNGWAYIENVIEKARSENWSSEKLVNLFIALPLNKDVWETLNNFDVRVQQEYWKKVASNLSDLSILSIDDVIYFLKRLVEVKEYCAALNLIYNAHICGRKLSSEIIVDLLRQAALEENIGNFSGLFWEIEELFKILDQSKVSEEEIAYLELLYFPILAKAGSGRPPKILYKELSKDPKLFASAIEYFYNSKDKNNEEEAEELPEELKKQRATFRQILFDNWKTLPGIDDNKNIDFGKLKSWIDEARELCKKLDLIKFADIQIGQILALALEDEKGSWPPEEICKVIDEIASEELDEGFITSIYNKRGPVSKSSLEGGEQERELAEQYERYSKIWRYKYPTASNILREISDLYKNEARREDERAIKDDLK